MSDSRLSNIDIRHSIISDNKKRRRSASENKYKICKTAEIINNFAKTWASSARDALVSEDGDFSSSSHELNESAFCNLMLQLDREKGYRPFAIPQQASESARQPHLALIWPKLSSERKENNHIRAFVNAVSVALCESQRLVFFAGLEPEAGKDDSTWRNMLPQFGVEYSLNFEVRIISRNIVVFCFLISTIDERMLWAKRLEPDELFKLTRLINTARSVASELLQAIERREIIEYPRSALSQAYRQILISERQLQRVSAPSIYWAREASLHAFAIAPNFPIAAALIARTHYLEWVTKGENRDVLLNEGRRWAVHATHIDPSSSAGFREAGLIDIYQGRFDSGLGALAEAERINPNEPESLVAYADALYQAGRHAEAEKKIDRAIMLQRTVSDITWWTAANISFHRGQYTDAVQLIDRMVHVGPADRCRAAAYSQLGQKVKASRCVSQLMKLNPAFRIANWMPFLPYRDDGDRQHYARGLHEAGFPS